MKSENRMSEKGRDVTKPGKTEKVSGIEKVGGSGKQGGVRFPVVEHPEVCDVARTPGGKMDK